MAEGMGAKELGTVALAAWMGVNAGCADVPPVGSRIDRPDAAVTDVLEDGGEDVSDTMDVRVEVGEDVHDVVEDVPGDDVEDVSDTTDGGQDVEDEEVEELRTCDEDYRLSMRAALGHLEVFDDGESTEALGVSQDLEPIFRTDVGRVGDADASVKRYVGLNEETGDYDFAVQVDQEGHPFDEGRFSGGNFSGLSFDPDSQQSVRYFVANRPFEGQANGSFFLLVGPTTFDLEGSVTGVDTRSDNWGSYYFDADSITGVCRMERKSIVDGERTEDLAECDCADVQTFLDEAVERSLRAFDQ